MTWDFKKYEKIYNEVEYQTINVDHDELVITGYKNQIFKTLIFYFINLPLFGAPILFYNWYPQLLFFKYVKTCLKDATNVLIQDSNENYFVSEIFIVKIPIEDTHSKLQKLLFLDFKIDNEIKYFIHKGIRYIWSHEQEKFFQIQGWNFKEKKIKDIIKKTSGFTKEEENILINIYGKNEIIIPTPTIWKLFIAEITRPFYLFQIFSIILWIFNEYSSYAACVGILSCWSIFTMIYTFRKQRLSLQNLSKKTTGNIVSVIRKGGVVEQIDPAFLVPGDIIQIPQNGCVMPCDAILLKGHCIVNENILTGESFPVFKIPPVNGEEIFNSVLSKRHVLYCGTQIMQTRYYGAGWVTGLIISTGYSTVKGELIRSVLYPKSTTFKFYEDSVKFIFFLFGIAICGIAFFCFVSYQRKASLQTLIFDSLDLITIVVPPSLPAALTTAIAYSQQRLFSKGVLCIAPEKIIKFGKLKLMCFDKTGTLTEEGINVWGIIPCMNQKFGSVIQNLSTFNENHPLVVAFATCHSLIKIRGKLSGDPLDLSMFNSIEWELSEPGNDTSRFDLLCPTVVKPKHFSNSKKKLDECKKKSDVNMPNEFANGSSYFSAENLSGDTLPYEIGMVREFSFSSSSRCMSVITRKLGSDHMNLYCKGAPEKIFELCIPNSLPKDFNEQLRTYTSLGFRVLGVAYKKFDKKFNWRKSQRITREEVEKDLIFLGLIIMQNKLKHASTAVINDLKNADIQCVMITGDNILTAASVSRECLLVQSNDSIIEVTIAAPKEHAQEPTLFFQTLEPVYCKSNLSKLSEELVRINMQSSDYHYALDGKTWELLRTHFKDLIPHIIVKCTIFARMLPEQKTQVIEAFQSLDYITGMCGDGVNDFGAMKTAQIGVSLSETEKSLVAPFVSKTQDISCIVTLIKEGRCALISTCAIFKYMVIYGLVQFISLLILCVRGVTFGNSEFLYVDLVVTSLLAMVIGRTQPAKILSKTRPIARLLSFENLLSLALQVITLFSIQILALRFLNYQKWFTPVIPDSEAIIKCWENSVVYCVSLFQFIILAVVYSKGKPYRLPFFKDPYFLLVLLAMILFTFTLNIFPFQQLSEFFELMPAENDSSSQFFFRIKLLIFPFTNFILSVLIDALIIEKNWLKKIKNFLSRKKISKKRYKRILKETNLLR